MFAQSVLCVCVDLSIREARILGGKVNFAGREKESPLIIFDCT